MTSVLEGLVLRSVVGGSSSRSSHVRSGRRHRRPRSCQRGSREQQTGEGNRHLVTGPGDAQARREGVAEVSELGDKQPIVYRVEGARPNVVDAGGPNIACFNCQYRPYEHVRLLVSQARSALEIPTGAIGAGIARDVCSCPTQSEPNIRETRRSGIGTLPT